MQRRLVDFWFKSVRASNFSQQSISESAGLWFGMGRTPAQEADTDQIMLKCAPLLDDPPRLNLGLGADLLAHCVLYDQVPRTIHSGTAKAFQYGERAEQAVLQGIANGAHLEIHPLERTFVYLVLMHSESLKHHRLAREMYTNTLNEALNDKDAFGTPVTDYLKNVFGFLESHTQVIERFGRYPHRNAVLGRDSNESERAWLESSERPGWAR